MNMENMSKLKQAAFHIEEAAECLMAANQKSIVEDFAPILNKMTIALRQPENAKWIDVNVRAGMAAHGKKIEPRPAGPYLVTDQSDPLNATDYEGLTIEQVIERHRDKLCNDFSETLGTVAYNFGTDQKLSKCFYFYDTSD